MNMKNIYDLYIKTYPDKLPESLEELAPLNNLILVYKDDILSDIPITFSWSGNSYKDRVSTRNYSRLASYLDMLQGQTPYEKIIPQNNLEQVLVECASHMALSKNLNAFLSISTPNIKFDLDLGDIWRYYHDTETDNKKELSTLGKAIITGRV